MTQHNQFNPEDQAPEQWVQAVERAGAGAARWRDGSWGNNAAPSWELVDPDDALYAEAFYYAPENAERFRDTSARAPMCRSCFIRRTRSLVPAIWMRQRSSTSQGRLRAPRSGTRWSACGKHYTALASRSGSSGSALSMPHEGHKLQALGHDGFRHVTSKGPLLVGLARHRRCGCGAHMVVERRFNQATDAVVLSSC